MLKQGRVGKGSPEGGRFLAKPSAPLHPAEAPSSPHDLRPRIPPVQGTQSGQQVSLPADVASAIDLIEELSERASQSGLTFEWVHPSSMGDDTKALLDIERKMIFLRSDMIDDPVQAAEALTHELAHWNDPWYRQHYFEMDEKARSETEVVAQTAAYVVCDQWGLDNEKFTVDYLEHWLPGSSTSLPSHLEERVYLSIQSMLGLDQ